VRNEDHSLKEEFATRQLFLATYIIAADLLPFSHVEPIDNYKFKFVFVDPDHRGPQFALDLERGAKAEVRSIFAAQNFLRRAMSSYQSARTTKSQAVPNGGTESEHTIPSNR
jgi:hypothetical protein